MLKRNALVAGLATLAVAAATTVQANEAFGLGQQAVFVPATSFHPGSSTCPLEYDVNYYYARTGSTGSWCGYYDAHLDVPEGAKIQWLSLFAYDNDASNITASIQRNYAQYSGGGSPSYTQIASVSTGTASTNYVMPETSLGAGHVVDTFALSGSAYTQYNYSVRLVIPVSTLNLRVRGAWVHFSRTNPAAPASASFTDVPTSHPFFKEVEQLKKSGITLGCGGTQYCPDQAVTRAQMAAFLGRAFGLHWDYYSEPAP